MRPHGRRGRRRAAAARLRANRNHGRRQRSAAAARREPELLRDLRAKDALRKARKVLNVRRGGQLRRGNVRARRIHAQAAFSGVRARPTRLTARRDAVGHPALEHDRVQHRARRVNSAGVASRAAARQGARASARLGSRAGPRRDGRHVSSVRAAGTRREPTAATRREAAPARQRDLAPAHDADLGTQLLQRRGRHGACEPAWTGR